MTSDGEFLTSLRFQGQQHGIPLPVDAVKQADLSVFIETCHWLDRYFGGVDPGAFPPLRLLGTPFRQQIWKRLMHIPYGQSVTYGDLAQEMATRLGQGSMSAQAVGGAVGHNPIALIVPCHRVLGAGGKLVGYAGGLERKSALLRLEHIPFVEVRPPLTDQSTEERKR